MSSCLFGKASLVEQLPGARDMGRSRLGKSASSDRIRPAWARRDGAGGSRLLRLRDRAARARRRLPGSSRPKSRTTFSTQEVDASALTIVKMCELGRESQVSGWGRRADGLPLVSTSARGRKDVIRQFLVLLKDPLTSSGFSRRRRKASKEFFEDLRRRGAAAVPLSPLPLWQRRDLAKKQGAAAARKSRKREGLDGRPLDQYVRLIQKHRQNLGGCPSGNRVGAMLSDSWTVSTARAGPLSARASPTHPHEVGRRVCNHAAGPWQRP